MTNPFLFVAGFLFSLPFTILCARAIWPGDGQGSLAAMMASFFVGLLTPIVGLIMRLAHRR